MKKHLVIILIISFMMTGCNSRKNINQNFNYNRENSIEVSTKINSEKIATIEQASVMQTEETVLRSEFCIEMNEILEKGGYTLNDIGNSSQLITVVSNGCQCKVSAFERTDNKWSVYYLTSGIVGKDGVSENSSESNSHTPKGIFDLEFAFGTEPLENLSIEYKQINENCYWIDDPESELYNQWVESENIYWNSAEHLIEYPESYKYAVSINYNMTPVVPYAGSAIFLHCNDLNYDYTAGCIAIAESNMLDILKWLDRSKTPKILII